MNKFVLLLLGILFFSCKLNAQDPVRSIDSTLNKAGRKNSRFDHIVVGPRADRTIFFYHKSNKKMFSIIVAVEHRIRGQLADTMMTSTGYFFIDDKLVKIYPKYFIKGSKPKKEFIYFQDDRLLADKSGRNYSPEAISAMIAKAYELLVDGNSRIQQKLTDR